MNIQDRPQWQIERGERYGNLRRQEAELKVRRRRNERAKNKRDAAALMKEF